MVNLGFYASDTRHAKDGEEQKEQLHEMGLFALINYEETEN